MNILEDKEYIRIENIKNTSYERGVIEADTCDIYKNGGLFLLRKGQKVFSIQTRIKKLQEIILTDEHYYHIKTESPLDKSFYLNIKLKKKELFRVGDYVVRKDNGNSMQLFLAGKKNKDFITHHEKEIEKELLWKIKDIIYNELAIIENRGVSDIVALEDVIYFKQIKEWIKEREI